jgi:hypothetical protein
VGTGVTDQRRSPIAAGFAAISHHKLVLLLALTSALLGLTAAIPALPTLQEWVGGTLAGDIFIRNHPTQAPGLFFDLVMEKWPAFAGVRRTAGWMGAIGVVLQMFFAGGIVAVLGRGRFGFGQFLEPARRNFWHNVKCFFLFALMSFVVLGIWVGATFGGRRLLQQAPPDAGSRTLLMSIFVAGAVLLFAALSLLYDFARAARRYAGVGAFRGYRFARRALSGAWLRALGLWLFWAVVGGVAVLLAFYLAWIIPAASPLAILVMLILQFGVLWLRSAVRVAAWGSYVEFLDGRARDAIAATARIRYTVATQTLSGPHRGPTHESGYVA